MRFRAMGRRERDRSVSPMPIAGRVPPHDLDAERGTIAASLLDDAARSIAMDIVQPKHFYSIPHQLIWEAIVDLSGLGKAIDILTVAGWLRDRERLQHVGGAAYLASLADATPAVRNVAHHAQIVRDKWQMRELIAACQRAAAEGYGDIGTTAEWLDSVETRIRSIVAESHTTDVTHLGGVLKETFDKIAKAAERGERITGIATGYERIDAKMAGLHNGDLTIIAARPGMGKTALALNMGVNIASPRTNVRLRKIDRVVADAAGHAVAIFSLEMPRDQLAMRMVCSEGRVDVGKLKQGFLQPEDWRRLTEAGSYLSQLPIWIDDRPAITLMEIRAKLRKIIAEWCRPEKADSPEQRLGLVVVDYLQLMGGRGDQADNREQEIAGYSRGLKQLAKEFDVPVIALSQLNRAVETRSTKDKKPQLSDLRESGSIEQDADNILFVYRDEYYNPDTTQAKGLAEIHIAKQRNGPTGRVMLRFSGSCTRFDNLAPGEHMDEEAA